MLNDTEMPFSAGKASEPVFLECRAPSVKAQGRARKQEGLMRKVVGDIRAGRDTLRNKLGNLFKKESPLTRMCRMCEKKRCSWAGDLPIYIDYHDNEWGRPVHNDIKLFELLILEGMQAGLSWITVLRKREAFRQAFDGFNPARVALYDEARIQGLLTDEGIIRNRLKVNAAVTNAKAFLKIQEHYGSFDTFIWAYVDHTPIRNHWKKMEEIPAKTPLSDQISKDLKKRGFTFVGSTIVYAFMQAAGMVNDHVTDCFVYREMKA